jgi:hypothetical protein
MLEEAIHKAQKFNATDLTLHVNPKEGKLAGITYVDIRDIHKIANTV